MTNTATNKPVDVFADHRIDLRAARDGVWIEIKGDRFLVARIGNERTIETRVAFLQEKGLPPDGDVPDRLKDEWAGHMFARCLLLDAKFHLAPDVKYTPEHGEQIWHDKDLAETREKITAQAVGDYTVKALSKQALLGNSKPSSNGSASAAPSPTP